MRRSGAAAGARIAFEFLKNSQDLAFDLGVYSGAPNVFALGFRIQIAGCFAQDPSGAPLLVGQSLPSRFELIHNC